MVLRLLYRSTGCYFGGGSELKVGFGDADSQNVCIFVAREGVYDWNGCGETVCLIIDIF